MQGPVTTQAARLAPGLGLTIIIGAVSLAATRALESVPMSPLILALAVGAAARNMFDLPEWAAPGVSASSRYLLRAGIVVVGLQISVGQIIAIGVGGLTIIVGTLLLTFCITVWLGARMGIDSRLVQLIAAGTSICGASAVIATNSVTHAQEEDVAYAVAMVSVFGSAAVFLYPLAAHAMKLSAEAYGLWAGTSIHEIGQVAAAAQIRQPSGEIAMVAKLSRVALLAPIVFCLAKLNQHGRGASMGTLRVEMPWFLLGFLALILVGSTDLVSGVHRLGAAHLASWLLTVALAGMGLELDLRNLRARGWRPMILGAIASLFICLFSLVWILWWNPSFA